MKIAVGSQNPVKIEATLCAFKKVWPKKSWTVKGYSVASGINSQRMSDIESISGAKNRANGALILSHADFSVGLEGGIQIIGGDWYDCGWIVVIDKKRHMGIGSTARILTPKIMIQKINQGMELGSVDDEIFNMKNSKHGNGHFGLMTKNAITRTSGYRDGVIMALARFIRPRIYSM